MPNRSTRRRRARGRPAHHRRNPAALRSAGGQFQGQAFCRDGTRSERQNSFPGGTRFEPTKTSSTNSFLCWPVLAATACIGLSGGLALTGLAYSLPPGVAAPQFPPSPLPVSVVTVVLGTLITFCGSKLPRQVALWLLAPVLRGQPGGSGSEGVTGKPAFACTTQPSRCNGTLDSSEGWSDRQLRWITLAILCLGLGVALAATYVWQSACVWLYGRLQEAFVWSDPFLVILLAAAVALVELPAFLMLGMTCTCLARLWQPEDPLRKVKMMGFLIAGAVLGAAAATSLAGRLPAIMLPALAALPALVVALVCACLVESIGENADTPSVQKGSSNGRKTASLAQDTESSLVGFDRPIPYPRMGRARPAAAGRGADSRRRLTA